MSFSKVFHSLSIEPLLALCAGASERDVDRVLRNGLQSLTDFAIMLSPAADGHLEELCSQSQALTRRRFGRVIRLFAPLYLSNECINNCRYCGFSRDNAILRVTLSLPEVLQEAESLAGSGFRNVLLVAGEHPKFVSNGYLRDCITTLKPRIAGLSLEVGPMETVDYVPLVNAGAEGLVVYQETYDAAIYEQMHTAGPKRDFDWRLDTAERAYEAGFRRLGIGALFGLSDWRTEALSVAAHAVHLLKHCWKAQVTISLPRLRPCAGEFQPLTRLSDRDLVRLVACFRLLLPDVGLVLSTREPARIREGLIPLGITLMSAGSHTEPGGYTGAGKENVHLTTRGRVVTVDGASEWTGETTTRATGQFNIADERSAAEIAGVIRRLGYEPVWKDWDQALS